jgi:hypothetical protein
MQPSPTSAKYTKAGSTNQPALYAMPSLHYFRKTQ